MPTPPPRLFPALALGIVLLSIGGCASGNAGASGRSGNISFETVSPSSLEFIRGQSTGPVVITGELTLPRGTGRPAPAVVLIHGSSGVGRNMPVWIGEFTSIGVAAFVVDSFGGRNIRETATDREAGADAAIVGFPGAHHGFDVPGQIGAFILPSVQNGSGCDLVEKSPGVVVSRASGLPVVRGDPCVTRGATVGYEPRAQTAAIAAVKEFLTTTFTLARR